MRKQARIQSLVRRKNSMKKALLFLLIAATPALTILAYSLRSTSNVSAESAAGPLYGAHAKLTLSRNQATGEVTGSLEQGVIAVAYVNLWSRQTVERSNALYTPVATITDVQPVILFGHCDLPYKFALVQGRLEVSGKCENTNWAEPPIDVVVLYSR